MTSNEWKDWRAQVPSPGFAERTVAAVVRERRGARARRTPRWAAFSAFAAVLIAGAAWGFASWSLRSTAAPSFDPPEQVSKAHPTSDRPLTTPIVDPPSTDRAALSPTPTLPSSRRKIEAPAPVSPMTDGGRKVILPRCNCSSLEAVCDCF
jgi:hypothetical protein